MKKKANPYSKYFGIEKQIRSQDKTFDRKQLISQFTDGKKTSLTELTTPEYIALLLFLQRTYLNGAVDIQWTRGSGKQATQNHLQKNLPFSAAAQKMRMKIISQFRAQGHEIPDPKNPGEMKANMEVVYGWVKKYGYLHKPLMQYTEEELPKLVYQAENSTLTFIRDVF